MLKKILLFICLLCLVSVNVFAVSDSNEFYVYGEDTDKVAKILDMTETQLESYVKDTDITYLAVNKENTKQIKKVEFEDEFSKKVQSFLSLKDEEILDLTESLSGIPDVSGQIVEKGKLKYLKINVKTNDSGGEYILTQYITVDGGKNQIISFYTDSDEGTDYIEDYFSSDINKVSTTVKVFAIIGTILFSVLAVVILIAIIRDTFFKEG